jgi:hypothetical protein
MHGQPDGAYALHVFVEGTRVAEFAFTVAQPE